MEREGDADGSLLNRRHRPFFLPSKTRGVRRAGEIRAVDKRGVVVKSYGVAVKNLRRPGENRRRAGENTRRGGEVSSS